MRDRVLLTSLRYLSGDTPRQSRRGKAYGDLEEERLGPAGESLDNAHQDEEDGKSVHMASTLQWQFELFPVPVELENRTWAETLEYQVPELLLAASGLQWSSVM